MGTNKFLWLLAAISFGLGAIGPNIPGKIGTLVGRVGWMLAGFAFIALTFVF